MRRHTGTTVAVLLVALLVVVPAWSQRYVLSLFTLALVTALLAVSVNMLAGEVGLVSMGHAGISASAAYAVAWAIRDQQGLATQLSVALLVTLLVSALYGLTAMRTSGLVFLMITLALGMVVYGLAFKWSKVTGGQSGLTGIRRPESLLDPYTFYYFCLVVLAVTLCVLWAVGRSPLGLSFRGIRDSEGRMNSLGYATPAIKFVAMMVSGLVAGVAGVLAVWNSQFMSPSAAAFEVSAIAVIIIIIGGVGSPLGPIIGAGLVVGIEHWLSSYVERWPTLLGLLFIAVVILMPRGVAGVVWDRRTPSRPALPWTALLRRSSGDRSTTTPSDEEIPAGDLTDVRGRHQEG
ncbi:MAG: branched-chain amino acid ABC transporter permease [Nocardioidaceae bacterium]